MTARTRKRLRFGLWGLLVAGWAVAVWLMWAALGTVPPEGPPEDSPLTSPTMRTFFAAALFSGLELAVVLAILWPRRAEYYAPRLALCALALATWLVLTAGIDDTGMDRVHRQWLVAVIVVLLVALLGTLLYRALPAGRTRDHGSGDDRDRHDRR